MSEPIACHLLSHPDPSGDRGRRRRRAWTIGGQIGGRSSKPKKKEDDETNRRPPSSRALSPVRVKRIPGRVLSKAPIWLQIIPALPAGRWRRLLESWDFSLPLRLHSDESRGYAHAPPARRRRIWTAGPPVRKGQHYTLSSSWRRRKSFSQVRRTAGNLSPQHAFAWARWISAYQRFTSLPLASTTARTCSWSGP